MGTRDKYDPVYRAIVDGLIAARKARGMTQIDVAKALGTDQSQISKLERGERRFDVLDFVRYARAVDQEPGQFLDRLIAQLG